jgi:cysteine desulfurase family protein (TIGR01976 family)
MADQGAWCQGFEHLVFAFLSRPQRVTYSQREGVSPNLGREGGAFMTSEANDAMASEAHAAVADFVGSSDPSEIKFGQNMTSLTFHVSRAIGATLSKGDEILVTTLDHEANVSPWHAVAHERDLVVRTVDIRPEDCTLDVEDFQRKLNSRTRVAAFGYASNAVGTINPVASLVAMAHQVGALAFVDAVHYAPHAALDVRALGADLLVCSAYKWFGPHVGVLYCKTDLLGRLSTYKVRPAHDAFETGTLNFEALAGVLGTIDYLQDLGTRFGQPERYPGVSERRSNLLAAGDVIKGHELVLMERLLAGLVSIPSVRIWGIADQKRLAERTPTFGVTLPTINPRTAAAAFGRMGIFAWDGHFYAQALIERLGLFDTGGVLRLGLVHYNTVDEVDRLVAGLERMLASHDA